MNDEFDDAEADRCCLVANGLVKGVMVRPVRFGRGE